MFLRHEDLMKDVHFIWNNRNPLHEVGNKISGFV